jgi:preprotein translocase subunit SecF
MLFGVVIGTYSSIFIAAPLLGYLGVKREWSGGGAPGAKPSKAAAAAAGSKPPGGAKIAFK